MSVSVCLFTQEAHEYTTSQAHHGGVLVCAYMHEIGASEYLPTQPLYLQNAVRHPDRVTGHSASPFVWQCRKRTETAMAPLICPLRPPHHHRLPRTIKASNLPTTRNRPLSKQRNKLSNFFCQRFVKKNRGFTFFLECPPHARVVRWGTVSGRGLCFVPPA